MSNNIEGKVIFITGASSGLGEATARLLSEEGAPVVLGARHADRIRSLVDELTGNGGKALAVATDVIHRVAFPFYVLILCAALVMSQFGQAAEKTYGKWPPIEK